MQAKRWVWRVGVVSLAAGTLLVGAEPPQDKGTPSVNFQDSSKRMLSAIENNRPEDLGFFLSSRGVTLGVDTPPTPKSHLIKMLRERNGFFCAVFDSKCLAKEDAAFRKRYGAGPRSRTILSYRDRLLTAKSKELRGGISKDFGGKTANLAVILERGTPKETWMDFEFLLEHGEWRLSGLPDY